MIANNLSSLLSRNSSFSLIIIILLVWFVFQLLTDGVYLSSRNLGIILLQFTILCFVTLGMVLVVIVRSIDLSVASVIMFIVVIATIIDQTYALNPLILLILMLFISILVAAWQGFFVAKLAIPAFIVTLAGQLYFRGAALVISGGKAQIGIPPLINALTTKYIPVTFSVAYLCIMFIIAIIIMIKNNLKAKSLGLPYLKGGRFIASIIPFIILLIGLIYISSLQGLPWLVAILFLVIIVYQIILHSSSLGRFIFAVGDNPTAALLAGIKTEKIIFITFILMGISYFLASIGVMSRLNGFVPTMVPLMELNAIASAVIGGTSLLGGYGSIIGGVLGALLLTSIDNGMTILNVPTFYQYIAKGLILLIAVIIDIYAKSKRS